MSNSPVFQLCYDFWYEYDILGSVMTILGYFNDENVDVEVMSYILNKKIAATPALRQRGWQPNFKLVVTKPEPRTMTKN